LFVGFTFPCVLDANGGLWFAKMTKIYFDLKSAVELFIKC